MSCKGGLSYFWVAMQSEHIALFLFLGLVIYVLVELYQVRMYDRFLLISKITFLGFMIVGIPYLLFIGSALLSMSYLYETHIAIRSGITDHARTLIPPLVFVLIVLLSLNHFEAHLFWLNLVACLVYGIIILTRIKMTRREKNKSK